MNLDNLKQNIRYSVGDSKAEKFDNPRVVLAISKVIDKLNRSYHINKQKAYIKVNNYQETYTLPEDFYFLEACKYKGKQLKLLDRADSNIASGTSDDTISYAIFNKLSFNKLKVQPVPDSISTTYKIVDVSGVQTTVDFDTVTEVKYKDGEIYLLYGTEVTDFENHITATIEADYGVLEIEYIAVYDLNYTVSNITFPYIFKDAIQYKVAADLLADDNRTEVQQKYLILNAAYEKELESLTDSLKEYSNGDLETKYRVGV